MLFLLIGNFDVVNWIVDNLFGMIVFFLNMIIIIKGNVILFILNLVICSEIEKWVFMEIENLNDIWVIVMCFKKMVIF